uniref:Importin-5-like isoform X2 n=1 Tax=Nicotiana sylvestris TaxID=4096 RepID=A0A1U7W7A7_NICSY|nr:PREDICTED: importin-5-like isoform X2 [Nicotiana sylvestris]
MDVPFETFISEYMRSTEDPDSIAIKLSIFICSSDIDLREKCAVFLRKLLTSDNDFFTWWNLSESTQSTIKAILLERISIEESESILKHLGDTVSDLAASLLPRNNWPELLPFLYQCLVSSSYKLIESASSIFEQLAHDLGDTVVPWVKHVHSRLLKTLNDDTLDLDYRIAGMTAAIAFIQFQCVSNSNQKEWFQELLPALLRRLTDTLSNSDEEVAAHDVLILFMEFAKNEPRFLRRQLTDVVSTMFEVAEDESLKEATRHLAIEFLLTLVETRKRAPGMMKRQPHFISRCFALLLKLLLDVKDDPAWHSVEIMKDDTGETSNFRFGKECLDRFSRALGGKSIAHIAIEQLCTYLDASEWEKRHAAIFALHFIAKGCSKVMIKNLEQVVDMVLNCFEDPHPRVRWAACRAISSLLIDFRPVTQDRYHNQIIPALTAAMDDVHPQVQASSTRALCFFCVFGKPETSISYLEGIVSKLLVFLQNDKPIVQQQALTALASVSRSVKEHFGTYYDTVMSHLKTVLRNTDLKSNLILRLAIECISSVAMAVGKEKFRGDEKQVMEVLMSLQGLQAKGDGPLIIGLLTAYTGICHCLGQDFLPYMSAVMPFFIQCAQLEPAMTISTQLDYGTNELDVNSIEKVLRVKAKSCAMLCFCAGILKEDFYPWIPQVVSIFVPLLKFYTRNGVRIYAVSVMSLLLSSAKLAVEKGIAQGGSESYFTKLSDYIVLALVEALHKEPMTEICGLMLYELNNCLQICGPLLTESQVRSIVNEIKHVITESSSRKNELSEREKTEDFDAEEAELLSAERKQEERVLSYVGEILRTLIKAFKTSFLPFLDELSPYLLPMENTTNERCTSILIFDSLVKECPEAALKYYDVCLPLVLETSNDEHPNVRQNALYGLGLWAEYGQSFFKPFVGEALSRIYVVLTHLKARELENESAYDNAVSALGKIYQFHGESIDLAQVIPSWLNCLPIKADLVEAKLVHEQLCSMVERSDKELLGPNYQYLPKVVSVFAEVLCSEKHLATKETADRMINVLRHFQQTLPPSTMESTWSYLLPQQEMKLKSILSVEESDLKAIVNGYHHGKRSPQNHQLSTNISTIKSTIMRDIQKFEFILNQIETNNEFHI